MRSMRPQVQVLLVLGLGSALAPRVSAQARTADSAPAATSRGSTLGSRPSTLLWVEGGPDETTIWRGWPVLVHVRTLGSAEPEEVKLRGPVELAVTHAAALWLVPGEQSARLEVGEYTVVAGSGTLQVRVTDAPSALTPAHQAKLWRLRVHCGLATKDLAAAQRAADEWTRAAPDSYLAHLAFGDVQRALGDAPAALAAYDEALRRAPRGRMPPSTIQDRIRAVTAAIAARAPKRPSAPPSADEVRYHELVAQGDAALAAGSHEAAASAYAAAEQFRREHQVAISPYELEAKLAALHGPASQPASASRPAARVTAPAPAQGVVVAVAELSEAAIRADARGQWAANARAGSEYGSSAYSATRLVGPPDVPGPGDHGNAWCHHSAAKGLEWIELGYATPVHATEVRVRQNSTPGTIVKVEAIDPAGGVHLWWEGVDPLQAPPSGTLAWFAVRVPRTEYLVAKIRITLDLAAIPGWKEIDAVQLVGSTQ